MTAYHWLVSYRVSWPASDYVSLTSYWLCTTNTSAVVQKQQAQKASNTEYVQGKLQQLKGLEQELQKKTMSVAEQIKQSEGNLVAHEKAISLQQQVTTSFSFTFTDYNCSYFNLILKEWV